MRSILLRLSAALGGLAVCTAVSFAQALLPAGSDHTKVLTYGGRFESGDYRLSADEAKVQRDAAARMERALAPLTRDPLWQVNSVDEFRKHEDDSFPGGVTRAGLMSCSYQVELELDHDSPVFKDMQAEMERRKADVERAAAQAQAAAARGDLAALQKLQQAFQMGFTSPVVTVRVETNPRDVSRYLDPASQKIEVAGADYGVVTNTDPGSIPVTAVGLGAIVKNTIDRGYFIRLKPSRLWRTQHFVELSIEGDARLAARALAKVNLAELRHILD
jgi:hypothetical protein